jgi:intein/homing endonuclease/superfamily II DNA or RNA helicase
MAQTFIGVPACYPQLVELRKSKTASFKVNKYLKETTKLRYYQVVGSLHMMMLDRMVLGDATGIGKCVSEDTYIPTSKGLIRIGELCPDVIAEDTFLAIEDINILSHEGEKKASLIYYSGIKKGIEIKTSKGFELLGLPHHPILTPHNNNLDYNRLDSLKINDFICINRKGLFSEQYFKIGPVKKSVYSKKYKIPEYLNESLAELIGYFISEGCGFTPQTFQITQFGTEIHNRIRFLFKDLFDYIQGLKNKTYNENIIVHSIQISRIFESLGINVLHKSADKVIPKAILVSPKTVIKSFLKGYFEGDGSVEKSNKGISCSSKSIELIKQIQLTLLLFGIVSKRKLKMVKVKNERRPYWILYFFGKDVDIFKNEIGFVSKRKNEELNSICGLSRNTNQDIIPNGNIFLKKSMKDIITYLRQQPNQKNFSIKGSGWKGLVGYAYKYKLESYIYNKRKLTYSGLKEFIDTLDRIDLSKIVSNMSFLRDLYAKNIFFDKITSISEKKSKFFDFHVPEMNNFVGNGFINHNTIQAIAAYSWLLDKDPTLKLLVITPKSAMLQWQEEFEKFTQGISVKVITAEYPGLTGPEARQQQYKEFKENVLIINYDPLINEYENVKSILGPNYMMVLDEITAVKNRKAQRSFACKYISESARRVYGLSATIIKNGLEEVWGIYDVVVPGLFGNITKFRKDYCVQELMKIRKNGKDYRIPKTIGYKNLSTFKQVLDPYLLIRKKEEVATELPKLISRKVILDMLPEQKDLYRQALSGILYEERVKQEYFEITDRIRNGQTDDGIQKRFLELKEKYDQFMTTEGKKKGKLAALTYCQMISNGPQLLNVKAESSKELEFERLMKEELSNEKVILFTRFKSGIPYLEIICERNHIPYTKITGDVTSNDRLKAQHTFQDTNCPLIFITTAGSAAINLQSASVILLYDTPWSYGDLVQTLGRAQRIGSLQEHIIVIHFINKGTIDVRVMSKVTDKKELSDEILGDTAIGALDFTKNDEKQIDLLYDNLLEDAKNLK